MLNKERQEAARQALEAAAPALGRAHARISRDRLAGLGALEAAVSALWSDYLERLARICDGTISGRLRRFDEAARTDDDEYMDLPDYPEQSRQALLKILHGFNLAVGTYKKALQYLEPVLKQAAPGRIPRILDLASGHGGFPIMLAKNARRRGIALEASGSDIHPVHVENANARARAEGLPVNFRVVNAFDMGDLEHGEYDLLTINQAIHHFTPAQLARMIAEAARVAGTGFVGLDYQRYFGVLLWATTTYSSPLRERLPQPYADFMHDACVSGRKMYHSAELELIARAAAPAARVGCRTHRAGHNVLHVLRN